jgi:CO/xanthine dehydrogenase FAD-binding subunit
MHDKTGILADPTAGNEDRARAISDLIAVATPISDVRASAGYRMAMLAVMAERSLLRARNRLEEAMNG